MGCKSPCQRPEIIKSYDEFLQDLYQENVIGYTIDDKTRKTQFDNPCHLTPISKIIFELIKHKRIGFMIKIIEILLCMVTQMQILFRKRKDLGMKFLFLNFDKFFYNKVKKVIVLNDNAILTNFSINSLPVQSDSLNSFIYDTKVESFYQKLMLWENTEYNNKNCENFYSFLLINLCTKLFTISETDIKFRSESQKSSFTSEWCLDSLSIHSLSGLDYLNSAVSKYEKIRVKIVSCLNELSVSPKQLTFDKVKYFLKRVYFNEQIKEIKLYYEYTHEIDGNNSPQVVKDYFKAKELIHFNNYIDWNCVIKSSNEFKVF